VCSNESGDDSTNTGSTSGSSWEGNGIHEYTLEEGSDDDGGRGVEEEKGSSDGYEELG